MEQATQRPQVIASKNLTSKDRFALINFATTSTSIAIISRRPPPSTSTTPASGSMSWKPWRHRHQRCSLSALDYRAKDDGRSFNIVFFTDGQPTIGETNVREDHEKNTLTRNTANTRILPLAWAMTSNATCSISLAEQTVP